MLSPRLCAILAAICFLAVSCSNVPPPLVQAPVLAPASDPPAEAESKIEESRVYDTANPAYPILKESLDTLAGFPLDRKGAVDWMEALNSGAITPREGLSVTDKMEMLDTDIIMKNTKEMPYVKFPHNSHTRWLSCDNCHDEIFTRKAGGNSVNMGKIFRGQYCGACHGKVAFATTIFCERCHSIPVGGTKSWWYPW